MIRPIPCPPASTSPGESLPGGLLEGSYGRRERRSDADDLTLAHFPEILPMVIKQAVKDVSMDVNKITCALICKGAVLTSCGIHYLVSLATKYYQEHIIHNISFKYNLARM